MQLSAYKRSNNQIPARLVVPRAGDTNANMGGKATDFVSSLKSFAVIHLFSMCGSQHATCRRLYSASTMQRLG